MNIAIIGTGSVGGTLTRRLAALGHHIRVANSRGPETLTELAAETGAVPAPVTDVADDADVVIIAIPSGQISNLAPAIRDTLPRDAAVVDTGNYVPRFRDAPVGELDNGTIQSVWAQAQLRHPLVKAFNNIKPDRLEALSKPAGVPGRVALPVAGDDAPAKATVLRLIDELGFDGVDAGELSESWRQQPGTPVYLTDLDAENVRRALAAADPQQTIQWRARMASIPRK
jgi:8-hydroxy-5-deazaflavin:NADPH oxidoreductase